MAPSHQRETAIGSNVPHEVENEDASESELLPLVYGELQRIARSRLAALGRGRTLDTCGLVHEAYLRLADHSALRGLDRPRFLALASRTMRFVLVDAVRRRVAERRGGGQADVTLDTAALGRHAEVSGGSTPDVSLLALHEALEALNELSSRLVEVVDQHFFAGLTFVEIAEIRQQDERTVRRDWEKARLFLARHLGEG